MRIISEVGGDRSNVTPQRMESQSGRWLPLSDTPVMASWSYLSPSEPWCKLSGDRALNVANPTLFPCRRTFFCSMRQKCHVRQIKTLRPRLIPLYLTPGSGFCLLYPRRYSRGRGYSLCCKSSSQREYRDDYLPGERGQAVGADTFRLVGVARQFHAVRLSDAAFLIHQLGVSGGGRRRRP